MQSLVMIRADGGVSIRTPHPLVEDPAIFVERFSQSADPAWLPVVSWHIVDTDQLPQTRTDRDAWTSDGVSVSVNPTRKANLKAAFLAELKVKAKAAFADADQEASRRDRAIILTALDEINTLRDWITDFKAAVAAAATLAALKTAVAGLPNLPERTTDQAKAAVFSKIDNAATD